MKTQEEWLKDFQDALHANTRIEYYGLMLPVVAYKQVPARYEYFGQPIYVDHVYTLSGGAEVTFPQYDPKYLKDNPVK